VQGLRGVGAYLGKLGDAVTDKEFLDGRGCRECAHRELTREGQPPPMRHGTNTYRTEFRRYVCDKCGAENICGAANVVTDPSEMAKDKPQ
jgi:DNA-directed RNA polymerase subunit RPC12/RpoP